jgi:hypothetical protein
VCGEFTTPFVYKRLHWRYVCAAWELRAADTGSCACARHRCSSLSGLFGLENGRLRRLAVLIDPTRLSRVYARMRWFDPEGGLEKEPRPPTSEQRAVENFVMLGSRRVVRNPTYPTYITGPSMGPLALRSAQQSATPLPPRWEPAGREPRPSPLLTRPRLRRRPPFAHADLDALEGFGAHGVGLAKDRQLQPATTLKLAGGEGARVEVDKP